MRRHSAAGAHVAEAAPTAEERGELSARHEARDDVDGPLRLPVAEEIDDERVADLPEEISLGLRARHLPRRGTEEQ